MYQLFSTSQSYKLPVSVKGIIYHKGKYLLRKNEREEWELLGGKLEPHEEPFFCVIRELKEEAGITVHVNNLLDAWLYKLNNKIEVLILTYICTVDSISFPLQSIEEAELAWFTLSEIETLNMPEGYKRSIRTYEKHY